MAFDPDAYLASKAAPAPAPAAGFDPDAYLAGRAKKQEAIDKAEPSSTLERIGTGVADMVWGAGQLASRVIPGVDTAIVDQMVKDREEEYQNRRAAAGSEGFDFARMAGNIIHPANYFLGPARGVSAIANLGRAAAAGGNAAALAPVTGNTENFWREKGKQTTEGALTGAAVSGVGGAVARAIKPEITDAAKDLMAKGVTPTLGQMLGGSAKTIEDKLTSLPVVGDVIGHARRGSIEDLNRALYNMALEPIGGKSSAAVGREGVREVERTLSNAYNNLLTGQKVTLDPQFGQDVANIVQGATAMMSDDARKQFMNIVRHKIIKAATPQGVIDGDVMKAVDSQLGMFARQAAKSNDLNQRMIGDALFQVKDALRQTTARSNPQLQKELGDIDKGWAIYTRIRDAASRSGSKEGIVLPSTLDAAVRRLDSTVGKGGTARGTAPMRAFSDAANEVLGGNYPDSGTAGRAILNLLLMGGAMHINPASVLIGGAATLPYLPGMKKATALALTKRPGGAGAVADAVRTGTELAVPGVSMEEARR